MMNTVCSKAVLVSHPLFFFGVTGRLGCSKVGRSSMRVGMYTQWRQSLRHVLVISSCPEDSRDRATAVCQMHAASVLHAPHGVSSAMNREPDVLT